MLSNREDAKHIFNLKGTIYNGVKTAMVVVLLLDATAGYSQYKRYPYVQDGKIIVCREEPNGVKSRLIHPNWKSTQYDKNPDSPNLFAAKFEVAANDATGVSGDDGKTYWYEGAGVFHYEFNKETKNACALYYEKSDKSDQGLWRLPTMRELVLIKGLKRGLTNVKAFSTGGYWCWPGIFSLGMSSETSYVQNWAGSSGYTSLRLYTRCVKDL